MSLINISTFKGKLSKLAAKLLPTEYATTATNYEYQSGQLLPLKDSSNQPFSVSLRITNPSPNVWTVSTSYKLGTIVTNNNFNYICISDHTASSLNEPGVNGSAYWNQCDIYVVEDGVGSAESTSIVFPTKASLDEGAYLKLYTPDFDTSGQGGGGIYVWFNQGAAADPKLSIADLATFVGIQCNISTATSGEDIATIFKTTTDAYTSANENIGLWTSNTRTTDTVVLVNKYSGNVSNTTTTDASITMTTTAGVDSNILIIGTEAQTIYKLRDTWLTFNKDADIVKSTIPDNDDLIYYSGTGFLKKTNYTLAISGDSTNYPNTVYRLGVEASSTKPTVAIDASGALDTDFTAVWVYTYVTADGEESAPSPPSNELLVTAANTERVALTNFKNPVNENHNIVGIRIYRVVVGLTTAEYQLVNSTDISLAAATITSYTYYDETNSSDLGEVLSTTDYNDSRNLATHIIEYGQGLYSYFVGNKLYFNEPYKPYAWPIEYEISIAETPVGIAPLGGGILVCTTTVPSLISGTHPSSMTQIRLPYQQPCLSKKSIVSNKFGVTYAGADGLFMINQDNGVNLTEACLTRDQWNEFDLEHLHGAYFNNSYYGFFNNSSTGFIIKYNDPTSYIEFTKTGYLFKSVYMDGSVLYVLMTNLSTGLDEVHSWESSASDMTYTYRSKKFEEYAFKNYAVARVCCSGSCTFTLYVDSVLKHTESITNTKLFKLPSGYRGRVVEFEVTGTAIIDSIQLATSTKELMSL